MSSLPNNIFFALITLAVIPANLAAQPQLPPASDLPASPYCSVPKDRVFYIVKVERSQIAPEPQQAYVEESKIKYLASSEVTFVAPLERRINRWSDGSATEDWVVEKNLLAQSPYGNWINVIPVASLAEHSMVCLSDFERLTAKDYQKTVVFTKKKCFQFSTLSYPPSPFSQQPKAVTHNLWIDAATRLPVGLDNGRYLFLIEFGPTPQTALQLPAKYKQALD